MSTINTTNILRMLLQSFPNAFIAFFLESTYISWNVTKIAMNPDSFFDVLLIAVKRNSSKMDVAYLKTH